MTYKISIIVPVFNGEKTIGNLIESVIRQTMDFNDIELLLVDDKSNDNTKSIITRYTDKYENIKGIFLEENSGGAYTPRNIGLEKSHADYIIFMDADDLIFKDFCETLYDTITEDSADIVNSSDTMKFLDGWYVRSEISKEKKIVTDPLSLRLTAWGNIFKKDFLYKNNLSFQPYADDVNFALQAYTLAEKIIQLPNYPGYVFTVENEEMDSMTHSVSTKSMENTIKGYTLINDYLDEKKLEKKYILSDKVYTLYLVLIKFKGLKQDRLLFLKNILDFEKYINCDINIKSKPISILNDLAMKNHFSLVLFIATIGNKLYDIRKVKNFILKRSIKSTIKLDDDFYKNN